MFDPAYTKVPPHLTLVFPFSSLYSAQEVRDAVVAGTTGIHPFRLTLRDIIVKGTFLFMLPSEGKVPVKSLFRSLYAGLFRPFLPPVLEQEDFIPHMTIGTCTAGTAQVRLSRVRSMLGEYTALIDTISVEIIGTDSQAIMESEIPLKL